MGALRTINHPGVEIREYDLSQYTPMLGGTTALVMGFAQKGEDCIPLEITSKNAFLSYFGTPSSEAEKYFYYAASKVFDQSGRLIAAKLPYDNDAKEMFSSVTYSVGATSGTISSLSANVSISATFTPSDLTGGYDSYISIALSSATASTAVSTLDQFRTGQNLGPKDGFIIIDKTKGIVKTDIISKKEIIGYFPVVTTAMNALPYQGMLTMSKFTSSDASAWQCVSALSGTMANVDFSSISANLATAVSTSSIYGNSLSKMIASQFPQMTYDDNGQIDSDYADKVLISMVSMKNDPNENNKISFSVVESYFGSLDSTAKSVDGKSIYIGDIVNSSSQYIEFYGNISNYAGTKQIYMANQKASILGFTKAQVTNDILKTDILLGLDSIFDRMSNIDEVELDLVCDGGISNITQYMNQTSALTSVTTLSATFDPEGRDGGLAWTETLSSREQTEQWRAVLAKFITFCSTTRKDCMVIVDGLRPLVLTGSQKIVRAGNTKTIDIDILNNLKYMTGVNSNYAAMYMNWFKKVDDFTGNTLWLPPSINAMGVYIYTDRQANYWDAPAGLNRGIVYDAVDISFNPNGKQADSIYGKSFNYAVNYPFDGIILEGQKTLQTKPSAFDRVNVRRLFLKLERFTYKTARYYVYESSNDFTRTRLLDQLRPIFEDVKTRGGIYDYKLICSAEENNGPTVVDNNELRLAVMIKPTKTAEFIICDFYALSTGMSFSEVSI